MLNELKRIIMNTDKEGIQISRLPNNEEMMNKINEIVRYVNQLENKKVNKSIEGLNFKSRKDY